MPAKLPHTDFYILDRESFDAGIFKPDQSANKVGSGLNDDLTLPLLELPKIIPNNSYNDLKI